MWKEKAKSDLQPHEITLDSDWVHDWMNARLHAARVEIHQQMEQYKLSEALKTLYSLIWDDFCSWYLEWVKPGYEKPMEGRHLTHVLVVFEQLLELLHPFMPFVTEEVYHLLREQSIDLCVRQHTPPQPIGDQEHTILAQGEQLKSAITAIRDARVKAKLKNKDEIVVRCITAQQGDWQAVQSILCKQVNARSFSFDSDSTSNSVALVVGANKFYMETDQQLNVEEQRKELQKDLNYYEGFLASVEKKLSNERFVQNAKPEVIELERKKQSDAIGKISLLKESLQALG